MDEFLDQLASIRRRPAMYVGSTAFFGFINYLVIPVAMLIANGAKRIDAAVNDGKDEFEISSDAQIEIGKNEGLNVPFQDVQFRGPNSDAFILNALSQELTVSVNTDSRLEELRFSRGVLTSESSMELSTEISPEAQGASRGTTLRFKPDDTIFAVTAVSKAVFASYFRRLSYLHEGVRFTLTAQGDRQEYFSENGIEELFAAISAPYQLMHEPIHIAAHESELDLQIIMAYQSWKDNHLCCFINNGRAVEGGTHEQGLVQALKSLKNKIGLPESFNSGVVALAYFRYPGVVWEGCIKAKIGNPELKTMVSRLVVNNVVQWVKDHQAVDAQLKQLQTFTFPEMWSGKL